MSQQHAQASDHKSQGRASDPFAADCGLLDPSAPSPHVQGFRFSGISAGIKSSGAPDLGIIAAAEGTQCAGLFTQNQIVAAPVTLSRARLEADSTVRAVVVNSGNANACTGPQGEADALEMGQLVSETLALSAAQVQVSSTGVIGAPLPMAAIRAGTPRAAAALSESGLIDFAEAIRTTDTRRKVSAASVEIEGVRYQIAGASKGAGMIHPNMATMLAFICSDAPVDTVSMTALWREVCGRSFNAISVDGDTSTNDCALLLCSGAAGGAPLRGEALARWGDALEGVALALALSIAGDGEGVNHLVAFQVKGARTEAEARQVADTVALSPLVKTAIHGRDPNWGRIIAAAGRSGVTLEPERLSLEIASVPIYTRGSWAGTEAERAASTQMNATRYTISLDLDLGSESFTRYGTDLSAEYVRINADYRS